MAGVRILVGTQDIQRAPTYVEILATFVVQRYRWFDILHSYLNFTYDLYYSTPLSNGSINYLFQLLLFLTGLVRSVLVRYRNDTSHAFSLSPVCEDHGVQERH